MKHYITYSIQRDILIASDIKTATYLFGVFCDTWIKLYLAKKISFRIYCWITLHLQKHAWDNK